MSTDSGSTQSAIRFHRAVWVCTIALSLIGAAAVIRRIIALAHPSIGGPPQLANLDALFVNKWVLTLLHIVPALLFIGIVPFQLSRSFRNSHLLLHRRMGRIAVVLALIIGTSALLLLERPVGGPLEVSAILLFDGVFLLSLTKAFLHIRRGEIALHREWMIRGVSVALGVATVRPIMGLFFATSSVTGLTPHDFFGIAFWIGFALTYIASEVWIRYTRPSARSQAVGGTMARQSKISEELI